MSRQLKKKKKKKIIPVPIETCITYLYVFFNIFYNFLNQDLFHCVLLKKLGVSDNELVTIPNAVASLSQLEELDISKNGKVKGHI